MNIDQIANFKKYDSYHVGESISFLPEQILEITDLSKNIKIPKTYKNIKNIVINGMGGSNLGAWILRDVFKDKLKKPLSITPGYTIPGWVNRDTLYIMSSYSGTTEEVLSVYNELKKRKAKILIITTGGKLEKIMKKDNIPGFIFDPSFNPSGQPRLGVGYSIFGMISLLSRVGLIKVIKNEIEEIARIIYENNSKFLPNLNSKNNLAKKIALQLKNKIPILVGAEFLVGNMHAPRNQFCETSKNFADYLEVPDLNHFAMEGLSYPMHNKKNLAFLFFDSEFYSLRVQKRMELTKKVIKKNGIEVISHKLLAQTKLEQSVEMLHLGTWITYYLGMLNNFNPVEVPYVDWFKKELGA